MISNEQMNLIRLIISNILIQKKDAKTDQYEQFFVQVCAHAPTAIRLNMTSDGKIDFANHFLKNPIIDFLINEL